MPSNVTDRSAGRLATGLPAALSAWVSVVVVAAVLWLTASAVDAQPADPGRSPADPAAPAAPTPAAPAAADPANPAAPAAPVLSAEQIEQLRAANERYRQSSWLVNMARSLAPAPPPPGQQVSTPLWQLDRRIVLLEAALRVNEQNDTTYLELYLARNQASQAYRQYAEQLGLAIAQSRAQNKSADADRLAELQNQADAAARNLQVLAVEALSNYTQLRPNDVPAWQTLLDEKLAFKSTAAERIAMLENERQRLQATGRPTDTQPAEPQPKEKLSAVLTMLAEYHIRQGGMERARELLVAAIDQMPLNRAARASLLNLEQLAGKAIEPGDRLELLLTDFRLNPTNLSAVEGIADLLARYGVYDMPVRAALDGKEQMVDRGALGFYLYDAAVRKELFGDQPLPADLLLQYGRALMQAGQGGQAVKAIRQAIGQSESGAATAAADDPLSPLPAINVPARILLIEALTGQDRAAAQAEAARLTDYYRANNSKPPFRSDAALQAWLGWFYLRIANNVETARSLGEAALAADGNEPLARRTLGAALAASNPDAKQAQRAIGLLEPLANAGEPWAAIYLARACRQAGQADRANAILTAVASNWPGHAAGAAAREALAAAAQPVPNVGTARLRDLVANLPAGLFEYYRVPGRFATVEVDLHAGAEPLDPITFLIRVSNRSGLIISPDGQARVGPAGSGFPVTVGPGMMLWPEMLVSVEVQLPGEPSPRVFNNYCHIRLPSPQVLGVNQWIMTAETVDIGPVEQLLRLTPQAEKTITFSLLVNPWGGNDRWLAGPGGYAMRGQFVRKALTINSENLVSLTQTSAKGEVGARLAANMALGSLLAEHQLAAAGQIRYPLRPIPEYRLTQPLADATTDEDPQVRAFLADAVYPAGISGKLREAALAGLSDPNWLVRLLTVRLMGDRIGPPVGERLKTLLADEKDPLVRRIAQSYLNEWAGSGSR